MTLLKTLSTVAALGLTVGGAVHADSHRNVDGMEGIQPIEFGDLAIDHAFARATRPGAPVGGGYMTITNRGDTDDRLISVATPVAGHAEIHEMQMDGDVMRMRLLADGLPIVAGETVTLAPGGYHVMFLDLEGPLVEGEIAPVTLTFENAGDVSVPLSVAAANATTPDGMATGQGH